MKRSDTEMEDISDNIKLDCCPHCVWIFLVYQKSATQLHGATANEVKFS